MAAVDPEPAEYKKRVYGAMPYRGLSINDIWSIKIKIGTTSAIGGTSMVIRVETRNERLKRIFEADNTKPAIEAVTVAINTMEAVYQSELTTQVNITPLSKNWRLSQAFL